MLKFFSLCRVLLFQLISEISSSFRSTGAFLILSFAFRWNGNHLDLENFLVHLEARGLPYRESARGEKAGRRPPRVHDRRFRSAHGIIIQNFKRIIFLCISSGIVNVHRPIQHSNVDRCHARTKERKKLVNQEAFCSAGI